MKRIVKDYRELEDFEDKVVVTLGNFDGVHLGHQAIIAQTKKIAGMLDLPSLLMTFEPHPVALLRPSIPPFRLTSYQQKAEIIENLGVDILLAQKFDLDFAKISAEEFVSNILAKSLKTAHIVIGHDFNFGHKREGDAKYLASAAKKYGFGFTQITTRQNNSEPFSSTAIRDYLQKGNPKAAASLLGRPFAMAGKVMEGDKKGRTISFPTANIEIGNYICPKFGVYDAEVKIENENSWHKAIANIGIRPTIGGLKIPRLEVHILDFEQDIYGQNIEVRLKDFIREEMKFSDITELKNQIATDIKGLSS